MAGLRRSTRATGASTARRTSAVCPAGIVTYANITRRRPTGPPGTVRKRPTVSTRTFPEQLPLTAVQPILILPHPARASVTGGRITGGSGTTWTVRAPLRAAWPASSFWVATAVYTPGASRPGPRTDQDPPLTGAVGVLVSGRPAAV